VKGNFFDSPQENVIFVAKNNDMLKKYIVCLPEKEGTVINEWEQCLKQLKEFIKDGYRPVKFNVFIDVTEYNSFIEIRRQIIDSLLDALGTESPAVNVTVHPPEQPFKVVVEAMFAVGRGASYKTKLFNGLPYVIVEQSQYRELWAAGVGEEFPESLKHAAYFAFDNVLEILQLEGMSFDNVVRQWNYIGNILEVRDEYQNYQIFNDIRSECYRKYRTVKHFPSATGVGMKMPGVFLDICAVDSGEELLIMPVSNPLQINAYEYGQQVLKGLPLNGTKPKNPPQFERALLVENRSNLILFISGTASIIGQETIGKGDIAKQVTVTINNIKTLSEPEHIRKTSGRNFSGSGRYLLLRVYIRRKEDFSIVKEITEKSFPGVPAVYIQADICRDDLLTETEAVMVFEPDSKAGN